MSKKPPKCLAVSQFAAYLVSLIWTENHIDLQFTRKRKYGYELKLTLTNEIVCKIV